MKMTLASDTQRRSFLLSALVATLWLTSISINGAPQSAAKAVETVASVQMPAADPPPCCVVTVIDVPKGVVTARETATDQIFQFRVLQNHLRQMKVGQMVWVETRTPAVAPAGTSNQPLSVGSRARSATASATRRASGGTTHLSSSCPQTTAGSGPTVPLGWEICSVGAARPAILLFHGLGNSGQAWMKPSSTATKEFEQIVSGYRDFRHTPDDLRIGKDHQAPNVGFHKVGISDALDPDASNWWEFLKKQHFTVATWDQGKRSRFEEAYASAKVAFTRLVYETQNQNPVPPIALIGHSRGGLLIRKLLKESPPLPGVERVRWVVTLHSPHHGSDMARAWPEVGAEMVDLMDSMIPASMPGPFGNISITGGIKTALKNVAVDQLRFLDKWWTADRNRELMTDGPLIEHLAQGETPRPGIKYYTFGGDTPTYFRVYVWVFDPSSLVPHYVVDTHGINTTAKQYFVWRVKAVELPEISPLLDKVRNFTPEITPGQGDGFVADKSARLPFSIHETTHVNHMEVLWDKHLQLKVLGILTAR